MSEKRLIGAGAITRQENASKPDKERTGGHTRNVSAIRRE